MLERRDMETEKEIHVYVTNGKKITFILNSSTKCF